MKAPIFALLTSLMVAGPTLAGAFALPTSIFTNRATFVTTGAGCVPHPRCTNLGPLQMANEEVDLITEDADERMSKSVDSVRKNLSSIRTGRANAAILDRVTVDYYGAPTPLNQMASISVPSAQQLTVEPYDKSVLGDVEKAIIESDVGVTPNNDGSVLRINIPSLTEERRKDLLKQCKAIGEEGKVAIRNIRRDGVDSIKKMEKSSEIGKDESLDALDVVQKLTDRSVKEVDDVVAGKEKEVMTV